MAEASAAIVPSTRVTSWSELNDALFEAAWNPSLGRFRSSEAFRGLLSSSFDLSTSLARSGGHYIGLERALLRNFRKYAHGALQETRSELFWLAVGQHHGLPTRLLDWTFSPYIAVHFATENSDYAHVDGAVWCVDYLKVRGQLSPEAVLEMSLVPPDDRPAFEYRIRQGEYIPFQVASAGQQATALLKVLLAQPGPPLIIDQPEDDLDSQVILDVVDSIWEAKTRRQLIFASHNANLVVNGDAELVVCCDYRAVGDQSRGQIKLEGAIDVPNVREEITTVMEGGEKAFRLRQEKYGF